jgi:hypothetical protein
MSFLVILLLRAGLHGKILIEKRRRDSEKFGNHWCTHFPLQVNRLCDSCCHWLTVNADRNVWKNVYIDIGVHRLLTLSLWSTALTANIIRQTTICCTVQGDTFTLNEQFLLAHSSPTMFRLCLHAFWDVPFRSEMAPVNRSGSGSIGSWSRLHWSVPKDPGLSHSQPGPRISTSRSVISPTRY